MQMNNRQCGSPLIDYVIGAAKASKRITQIICSTNHDAISNHCESSNVEIHKRLPELVKDDTPIIPVLTDLLNHYQDSEGIVPLAIVLMQPTSPFVTPEQIDLCVDKLTENSTVNSEQTVAPISHNQHAYHQRIIVNGCVRLSLRQRKGVHVQ